MALVDFIPDDALASIKNAPSAATKRVYGRILFADDTSTTIPPSVQLTGFPVYDTPDETHIFGKPYDAVLLDATGKTPMAGIWYADIPVTDDPDLSPAGVYATINHPDWRSPETRRVFSSYPAKVRWVDCELAVALPDGPIVERVWVGNGPGGGTGTLLDHTAISDFDEAARDAAAKMFTSATQGTGVTVTYDDAADKMVVTVAQSASGLDTEAAQDVFGAMVVQGGGTYNDAAGTVTFPVSNGGTATFDAEQVRDAMATASLGAGYVTVTANDTADTITFGSSPALQTALDARLRVDAAQGLTQQQKNQGLVNLGIDPTSVGGSAGSTILVWRYANGAWPALPSTRPVGVNKVESFGPTPPVPPTWCGIDPSLALFTYRPVALS